MSKRKLVLFMMIVVLVSLMVMAPIPPPPTNPATCTPGFWKQPQHLQYWVDYAPTDLYPADPSMTLLDALQGGYKTRVSRFVVAGWLNVANPDAPCD